MIFISYRRDGGLEFASHLNDILEEEYSVFFDLESMENGKFNDQLYEKIACSDDFILVASPNALDLKEDVEIDWMRLEIKRALDLKKNIIIVMLPGFSFPEKTDPVIEELMYYQAINVSYEYFDAFMGKLKRYLQSKPLPRDNHPDRKGKKGIFALISILVVLCGAGIVFMKPFSIKTANDPEVKTEQLLQNIGNEEEHTQAIVADDIDYKGTFVTYKSKNLGDIPIYDSLGDSVPSGHVPESRACQATDAQKYDGENWYYIDYCGIKGWIEGRMLRYISREEKYFKISSDRSKNKVYIDENKVKLHSQPSQDSEILLSGIPYGKEIELIDVDYGWGKIIFKNAEAFIDMHVVNSYCSSWWQVEICNGHSDSIALRKDSLEDSKKVSEVKVGTVIKITEFKNGWGKTFVNGKKGWVKLHYTTPCGADGLPFSEDQQ